MTDESATSPAQAPTEPGRLFRRGHAAGDFLEAWDWDLLDQNDGFLRVSAHVPDRARNPRGQLFGGFTPTYVDLIALATARRWAERNASAGRLWLATTNIHVDYFKPIVGPRFIMEARHETRSGRTHLVLTRFLQDGELAVHAAATMREQVLAPDLPAG